MTPEEIEQAIATAKDNRSTKLSFIGQELSELPESIGDLINLTSLDLSFNQLTDLPSSIKNITSLTELYLFSNQLNSLPESISNLTDLTLLCLAYNQLNSLPNNILNLTNLTYLGLYENQLNSLPNNIGDLINLTELYLENNQLNSLPNSIANITNLTYLNLTGNPLTDLSVLANIPNLETVNFFDIDLPRRYWTKFSDWKPEWLLDEDNAEVRHILIDWIGYEKICEEVGAIVLDTWREYTLISIDRVQTIYDKEMEPIDTEPMVLLKMTCPSTAHIHILRVPPEMVSAEEAITWVNHGIHPDLFAIQT